MTDGLAARGRLRALVVDDDAAIARLVTHVLDSLGHEVTAHAVSGGEALAALDAAQGSVDVVILDHQLPDTSGLDLLDAIQARSSPPAVVMITGHGSESLAAAALRRGADDYLAKDASLAHLLPEVLERVRRARALRKALAAAEADLIRAERFAAIGEMTVTVHHEINNPLTAALTEVELLLLELDAPIEERREGLEAVREALCRIADIVRRIGDLRQARTKAYGSEIRMVDLDGSAGSPEAYRYGVALVHLADEDLARVVTLLLRHAGFDARRSSGADELQQARAEPEVALVVVGGIAALSADQSNGDATRGYRTVVLTASDGDEARSAGADLVIRLPFDPGSFAGDILGLMRR